MFLRLGSTAFGGPAAHVAMMHRDVVRRRGWMGEQDFLDQVGITNLIPGPNSTELAMLVGRAAAGGSGLFVAGACFILPAAAIVLVLAWAYVAYGDTPTGEALLYGIEPAVIAIIAQALISLGRRALEGPLLISIALAATTLYLLGINELIVLFGGAALVYAIRTGGSIVTGFAPFGIGLASANFVEVSLDRLFLVFLKIGAVLYGSGYVLLAFLRGDLVERLGWLSQQQLVDAISIGQFTPGPVFTTATFVGYVVAGFAGAAIATVGIFLPSFVFAAIVGRLAPRVRGREWSAVLLDGVNASALGLMAGVTWQLGRQAVVDAPTAIVAAVSFVVLWRFDINSAWLVAAGAAVGLAMDAAGAGP
jgi:chromate transporter